MYVGASVGNTWQSADVTVDEVTNEIKNIDENSTGWKIFGGFQSEGIFGVEGGYRDLGKIKSTIEGYELSVKTTGWDVEAIAKLELSIIRLFAKAGAFFWSADSAYASYKEDESGTDFLWGLGAGVSLGPIGVRLEWESMEVSELKNLSMLSLGASLGF
jgi:OOP family OmpA-OmpF porin